MLHDYYHILKIKKFGGMGGFLCIVGLKTWKMCNIESFLPYSSYKKTPHIIRINRALNVMQSTQLLTNLQPCY